MKNKGMRRIFQVASGNRMGKDSNSIYRMSSSIQYASGHQHQHQPQHQPQQQQQQHQQQRQESYNHQRQAFNNDRTGYIDPDYIQEIHDADECFLNHDFDEAIALYLNAIPVAQEALRQHHPTVGDIYVKISTILQGRSELSSAVDHLIKAKDIYIKADENLDRDETRDNLGQKIIEITTGIANLQVDMGELDKASLSYEDVIKSCKKYCPDDTIELSNAMNNYANFLSMCVSEHARALEELKKALKITLKAEDEKMTLDCAPTLNNMGKLYLRRTKPSNYKEAQEDAKRAETCFMRAMQLYRMSMVKNTSGRLTETIYNMNEARERQSGKKGILRNVRFDSQPNERLFDAAAISFGSEDTSSVGSTVYTETTSAYNDFISYFNCGANKDDSDDSVSSESSLKDNGEDKEETKIGDTKIGDATEDSNSKEEPSQSPGK